MFILELGLIFLKDTHSLVTTENYQELSLHFVTHRGGVPMAVGSFGRGLRSSAAHSTRGSCLSISLASELAPEHLKSRNVSGIVSPHPWLNTRITKVLTC